MPTYSYACTGCGHAFDIRQSFTDDSLTVCPECGEKTLRKVIHPVGISFKGSGFYKTDSRTAAKGAASSSGAAAEGGSSDSSDSAGAGAGKTASSDTSSGSSGT